MPRIPSDKPEWCHLSLSECFPADFFTQPDTVYDASEMFAHIAFEKPQCGDCLITALVSKSGPRGLSAFLPDAKQVFYPENRSPRRWERSEPMLPLTSSWQNVDFSLGAIVRPGQDVWNGSEAQSDGGISLRSYAIKLLSRYAYVIGETPTSFVQVHNIKNLQAAIQKFDKHRGIAMACINDDQPDDGHGETAALFTNWLLDRWGGVDAPWEEEGRWTPVESPPEAEGKGDGQGETKSA